MHYPTKCRRYAVVALTALVFAVAPVVAVWAQQATEHAETPSAALSEVWRLDRNPEAPDAGDTSLSAGPVAYAPKVGEPARFFAMVLGQRLTVSDADGKEAWSVTLEGRAQQTLAVADVDRDGSNEILVSLGDAVLCVRDGGRIAWRREVPNISGGVACANVVDDDRLEVVAADGEGGVTCLSWDGRVLWHLMAESAKRPVESDPFISRLNWNFERYENRDATAPPTVGDVDGDGQAEILLVTEPGFVYCLSGRGEWKWQFRAEGKCQGAPVIADLDNDGAAEVVVGSDDRHLYILEGASGRERAKLATVWGVTPSIAAADLDGDGKREIVFGDEAGVLYCCDAAGRERWRIPFKDPTKTSDYGDRVVAPPAIADVDGDGEPELIVGMRGRQFLYIVSAAGKVEASYPLESGRAQTLAESGIVETPVVGDLDGHGGFEIIVATRLYSIRCFRATGDASAGVRWAGERGDPALTGCVLARRGGATKGELRRERGAQSGAIALAINAPSLVTGAIDATVSRPAEAPAVLLSSIRMESGALELRIDQVLTPQESLGIFVPTDADWPASIACFEIAAADGRVLATRSAEVSLSAVEARKRVHEETLAAADVAIQKLHLDWPNKTALAAVRALAAGGVTGEPPSAAEWAKRDVRAAAELRDLLAMVEGQRAKGGSMSVVTWTANPWDPFDPATAWPEAAATVAAEPEVALYQGEYEAAAVNLLNISASPLEVRVTVSDLAPTGQGAALPAAKHLELRQTAMVPRYSGDRVGDALIPLNEAGIISVAPMQAAQLWVTVKAAQTPAGDYTCAITLTEMTPNGKAAVVPLRVRVYPIALPEKSPVRFCTWAYLDTGLYANQADAAMADLTAHKNNVFTLSATMAVAYDGTGELGAPDWSALDKQVERYMGHGIMLITEPTLKFSGKGTPSQEAQDRAYAEAMRALATHLAGKGLAYADWAIYVTDEPGLEHGPRIEYLIEHGKRIKASDPRIQTYTDPVVVMGSADLERAAPYVDIWCPEQDSLYRLWGATADMHAEKRLAIMRADSSQVWTYECFPRVKRMSPLGYYRHQAWLAWTLGLNGLGFWTYCTDPKDPWQPNKDEYVLVYPGREGPIPSKRWEACRDGVEDYEALWLAKQAVEASEARGDGRAAAAKAEIEQLAQRVVDQRAVWSAMKEARQRLAEMTMAFAEGTPPAM